MKKTYKKTLPILVFIIIILAISLIFSPKIKSILNRFIIDKENQETIQQISEKDIIQKTNGNTNKKIHATTPIPEEAYLKVPFICQAPLQTEENWTLHEESCEEAAVLQAYLYETKQTFTKQEANNEILKMIEWQKKEENFGGHIDLHAKEMRTFITSYYNLEEDEVKIITNTSIDDIKKEIANGHPIIVPITGDILKNPYYPYPGYHMLTVIGYTTDRIITNDNGTRRGANFTYDIDTFKAAMNDAGGDVLILNLKQKS